jgi:hypothetical protein
MNKITRLSILAILSAIAAPTTAFANYSTSSTSGTNPGSRQQQTYPDKDADNPYRQEMAGDQDDASDQELIVDREHETTSSRMNRQAREVREASRSNQRFNPNWNTERQNPDRSNSTTNRSSTTNRNTQR